MSMYSLFGTFLLHVGPPELAVVVTAQQEVSFCIPCFPVSTLSVISFVADPNRAPLVLPEAEAEEFAG